MAAASTEGFGTVLQTYVPISVAEELRERAESESKSLSAEIRTAIAEHLAADRDPAGEVPE